MFLMGRTQSISQSINNPCNCPPKGSIHSPGFHIKEDGDIESFALGYRQASGRVKV